MRPAMALLLTSFAKNRLIQIALSLSRYFCKFRVLQVYDAERKGRQGQEEHEAKETTIKVRANVTVTIRDVSRR